jgi:glycosyltransferase involved in cell wall biosynthesis
LKILHVVPTYVSAWRHGGPIQAVHGLAKALVGLGHRVAVVTTNVHADDVLQVPVDRPVSVDGVEVRYFPVRWPRRLYRSPAIGRALAEGVRHFDIVHVHSLFLWPCASAARAAQRSNVPYVVAPRGMLVKQLLNRRGRLRKLLWLQLVERRNLARAAALHVLTSLEAEDAKQFAFRLPRIVVVPNGVDEMPYAGEDAAALSPHIHRVLEGGPYFLYLGRITWKKGLDRLLRALALCPEVNLAVAGNDEESLQGGLEQLTREFGVAHRVVFLGPVRGPDKGALLHHAVGLVLPSLSDNFANVVLEAMAAGCPVVVTPQVGLAPAVQEAGAGLVAEGDPETLGKALRELLENPDLRATMGRNGCAIARQRFAWPVVARQMATVYEEIIQQHRRSMGKPHGGASASRGAA